MELSQFLKKDRESKCLTQEEYAKQIGLTRSTLANLETGRAPSSSTSKKLVEYFKKPFSELLGEQKVIKMANLETTNLLIDSLIENDEISEEIFKNEIKELIWKSLSLEIALKLKLKKKDKRT